GVERLQHEALALRHLERDVLGPDVGDEWHGPAVIDARVPAGRLEGRRVGTVGRSPGDATIAYWVGNYVAEIPARPGASGGKVRMRVTHVFEKRSLARDPRSAVPRSCAKDPATRKAPTDCRWLLVQSHMSQPITDDELTTRVFGTALLSSKPLEIDCSDRARAPTATVPAAAPRPASPPGPQAAHIP
ncbi:MAG: hypothetical protein ABIY55_32775, partial [Kofleriaceae bacterium]